MAKMVTIFRHKSPIHPLMPNPTPHRKKVKPSNHPQNINKDVWYYEQPKSLHFIAYSDTGTLVTFKVPARKLLVSLKRMGYKVSLPSKTKE